MVFENGPDGKFSLTNQVVHNPVLLTTLKESFNALYTHLELTNLAYLLLLVKRVVLAMRALALRSRLPKTRDILDRG